MKKLASRLALLMLIPTAASAARGFHILDKNSRLLCQSDMHSLCVDLRGTDAEACLLAHADQIADSSCRSAVAGANSTLSDIMSACQADIDTHCAGMTYGSQLLKCLKRHRRDLSSSCKEQL